MKDYILLPLHLDALYLKKTTGVIASSANFSDLPFFDGQEDNNSDNPYISEEITAKKFENKNLYLRAGIHIHWKLPRALTTATVVDDKLTFPTVPNRWLITRTIGEKSKSWVVESDYYFPKGIFSNSISVPYQPKDRDRLDYQSYRYMGRKLELERWLKSNEESNEYFENLTAVGYGEFNFASFYPNCYSVFGFHDDTISSDENRKIDYEVIGWYSNPENEILYKFMQTNSATDDEFKEKISEEFKWDISKLKKRITKETGILCYSKLQFKSGVLRQTHTFDTNAKVEVAVGNTGMEALSAYFATTSYPNDKEKKRKFEQFIESFNLTSIFENNRADSEYKFREALHEKTFMGVNGGFLWDVKIEKSDENVEEETTNQDYSQSMILPQEIVAPLKEMNRAQYRIDKLTNIRVDLQIKTFADWYKYMNTAYINSESVHIPIDDIVDFIQKHDLEELKEIDIEISSLESDLRTNRAKLEIEINIIESEDRTRKFILEKRQSARYWQTTEPVLLIAGEDVKQSTPFVTNELRPVYLYTSYKNLKDLFSDKNKLDKFLLDIQNEIKDRPIYFFEWEKQPWNPFLLDWQVEADMHRPSKEKRGIGTKYDVDFFTQYYKLNQESYNLESNDKIATRNQLFSGRSFLTPYAIELLKDKIKNRNKKIHSNKKLKTQIDEIRELIDKTDCMSQSLSGFNDRLLMQKQTLVLAMKDPVGFERYRAFTKEVSEAVIDSIKTAPEPLNIFTPIRSGEFKINKLQLIDTFGQVKKLHYDNIIRSEQMINREDKGEKIYLPPRFVQPTRISFRWLEHQEHSNSLICGWLIQNSINSTIAVYNSAGEHLGSIANSQELSWRPAPGENSVKSPNDIEDEEIREVVSRIESNFDDFFDTLTNAIESMNPENFVDNIALAFLIGTPIAIAKASLNLELKGVPAINHDWNIFKKDMAKRERETGDFTKVKVPIKLGEKNQQNDGLVGYWIENQKDTFYTTDDNVIKHSFDDDAIELIILINPLSKLHITTGILPVKEIQIPKNHYSDALKNLQLMIMTTATLMPENRISLPLSKYDGFQWRWIARDGDKWSEKECNSEDEESMTIQTQEIREGWLALKPLEIK